MDLETYLLDDVVKATTPPNETETAARTRRAAIVEMVRAYAPADAMEGMIVCHCVMLQFLLSGAMRDANNTSLAPAVLARARSSAISISRTLHQWVTKFENTRKRSETRAAEARDATTRARTVATPGPAAPRPANAPAAPPRPVVHAPALHAPVPDGRAATAGHAPPASSNGSAALAPGQSPASASAERRPPT